MGRNSVGFKSWIQRVCESIHAVLGCGALAPPVHAQESADRIWTGGPILTMNDKAMRAEAVAERGGKIIAVGTNARVMKLKGSTTELHDLRSCALFPGFVDAHMQALAANIVASPDGEVTDIPSLQKTLRAWMGPTKRSWKWST